MSKGREKKKGERMKVNEWNSWDEMAGRNKQDSVAFYKLLKTGLDVRNYG